MIKINDKLNIVLNFINQKNYVEAINLIQELYEMNNTDLNKYLLILMDLFSVISCLTKKQKENIKNLELCDMMIDNSNIFNDLNKENDKRNLILQKKYSLLIEDFDNWENNVYQNILRVLIKTANDSEEKFKSNFESAIFDRKYEHAKNILESKLVRQRALKEEKITYQILTQLFSIMKTKSLPCVLKSNTEDYVEAISNNDFELALKIIEQRYINDNKVVLTRMPDYLLLRDICKVIQNVKKFDTYCEDNKINSDGLEKNDCIKSKYEEIKKYGIITIKTKNTNKIAKVLMDSINYPDISCMLLCNNEMIVLKYNPYVDTYSKVPKLMLEANKINARKKTKNALNLYLEALKFENVRSSAYSKIGLCFVELKSFSRAIDYLTVAMELGKKEDIIFDFHPLIARLQGKLQADEIKPHFSNKDNIFDFEGQKINFGLGDLTEINDFIISSGLDVESACISMGIFPEKIDLIKLVYAREFFSKGEIKLAEKFLKSVEQSENKTERVKRALDEIKKNKIIFINKKESTLTLSLKLKPKK